MKKYLFLLLFLSVLSSVSAFGSYYYTTRQGNILQYGTNIPVWRDTGSSPVCYTYSFSYNSETYYLIKDDSNYSRKSLLGCDDYSVSNMFDALVKLNNDTVYERLKSDELKKANIRLVKAKSPFEKLDLKNRKNDFDLDKIAYINLSRLYYFNGNSGEAEMYLIPESEYSSSGSKYMKNVAIKIKTKTKQQADEMF